ncbi:response regulator [Fluviispira multicolorata]|uniref:Response regulator n=1 Tax=Fluviispira multicolorata TaxID=2654512 RepID=A0A833JB85_9BACT|nr:response regulator [Fluviispira multicolorata]KAB8029067.1 response regulator [Fluviispira multicolorata]
MDEGNSSKDSKLNYIILIVDDNEENRLLMSIYLKKSPYKYEFAQNGEIAFEKIKNKKYDLILMDVQMPIMDGLIATREIRKWEAAEKKEPVPIIALTANDLQERGGETLKAGCTAHVTKPIKKDDFLKEIQKYIKN